MPNSVYSSSRVFPPANFCFHVEETVPKILLKSTNLQIFSFIAIGYQTSVRYGETTDNISRKYIRIFVSL